MLVGDSALNDLSATIIGAAIEVHRELGPGLLESAYQACLVHELVLRHVQVETQQPLRLVYRNVQIDCAYRLDLLVERQIIVEVKSVDQLAPIHMAQVMAYLKLARCPLGLILNFNKLRLTDGLRRVLNVRDSPSAGGRSA
jgi:GxxExxY protein